MEKEQKDEIIEELWHIKNQFSSSCNKDFKQIIKKVNAIAQDQGFEEKINENLKKTEIA